MSRQRLARRFDARSRLGFEREIKIPKDWTPRELGAGSLLLWLRADFGWTLNGMSSVTSTGTSPPVMAISAGSPLVPTDLRIEVVGTGTLGVATYRASLDGGNTWLPTAATAASVSVGPFTVTQAAGTYSANNVWIARSRYSALADLSGSGNNVSQGTAGNQPTAKYIGSRLHVNFAISPSRMWLRSGAFAKPSSYSLMVMGTKDVAATVSQWMCGSNNAAGSSVGCWGVVGSGVSGQLAYSFSNGAASATSYRTSTTPVVDATPFSYLTGFQTGQATQSLNYANGTSQAMTLVASAGSTSLGGTAYQFGVGCLGEYATTETWGGTIREIVIVNRQLSAADAVRMCAYSRARNGV